MRIRIKDIRNARPCKERVDIFYESLKPYQKFVTIEQILESNDVEDAFWVIGHVLEDRQACKVLARQFADSVKHLKNRHAVNSAVYSAEAATYVYRDAYYAVDAANAANYAANYAAKAATHVYRTAAHAAYLATTARKDEIHKQKQMIINYFK